MRVHVHTKFCFLCVLTFLFHPSSRCNGEGHSHQHGGHQHADHNHVHNDLQISEAPYVRGATPPPEPTNHQTHSPEEEQQFYIQKLFRRYGNKDRLDFQGFQSLLLSLGLGEVKVVGLDHDELGHDHVAHLDLLDVKEGLHTHSPNKQGHGKVHPHHPHTDQVPTECSYHTTAINPASGAQTGPDHDHDHNHDQDAGQGHDHPKVEDRDHKHSDGHVQDTHVHQHDHHPDHAHEKEHKHEQDHSKRKDQPTHDHSDHDHSDHDHSDHDHSEHDHSTHDHSDHDHSDHDHSTHDQSDPDHSTHDHSDHDHSDHDHSTHERVKEQVQYNQKDLSSQPHIDHDHSNHNHGDGDHSDHNHDKDHKHEQIQVQSENKDMSSHPRSGTTNSDHDHATHDHSDHDHTDHDHSNHDHSDHDHSDHDHGMERKDEQPQVRSGTKDLSSQPHSGHDHSDHDHSDHDHSDHSDHDHDHGQVHEVRTGTDTAPSNQLQQPPQVSPDPPPSATTQSQTKRPRKPIRAGGQLVANKDTSLSDGHGHQHGHGHDHDHDHGHGHGHSHSHKRKREAPGGHAHPTLPGPAMSGHAGGKIHQHEECLNLTELLTYYGLNPDAVISPAEFTYLCPALLYQIDSRVCIRHYHQVDVEKEPLQTKTSALVWLWGFVSITIISLLSLLGVVLVPILNQDCFKFLLTFLVALAVGTLSGDALLHLLPHSQGTHDHDHHGHKTSQHTDLLTAFDGVWKGLTALAGIYLLFIIEHCIGMFKHYKDHKSKKEIEEGKIGRKLSGHKLNRRSDAEWLHLKPISEDHDVTVISCDNGHNDTHLTELQPPDSPTTRTPLAPQLATQEPQSPIKENGRKAKKQGHGHGHSHGGNCHSDQEMKDAGIASIAWMVIMGDGMHNFSDGLAIGAAFSANLTGGISTSVAVFCHELPHELGDFAVLLKAGMSVKQAIVYNLLSALMAYVGMLIGTAVGQYTSSVTSWIFAITAGMFLYVALVDMLPEMLHGDSEDYKRCQLGHFILQNLGMLTGFGIMLLIAIFEDQIVFDFGFE